jgi:phosphoglycerate dehydrogenase-like enzyme
MTRIAVLDDYQQVAATLAPWAELDGDVSFFHEPFADRTAAIEELQPFDVIVAMRERTPFPADVLTALPNLRLLVTTGKRNASIDMAAASSNGVMVAGTDSPGHATAELTFALIQSLARGLHGEVESVREGGWQRGLGRDLRGSTLGLIGLGRLGAQVAGFGVAFGMNVVAWSENLTSERTGEVGARLVTFDELLSNSDFVSIHLRLSDRTRGMFSSEQFGSMKPDAYLVNTSRGPIVDTDALVDAVRSGTIAGAAVDVHDSEPLPHDHPIRLESKILATPHIGYVTRET